MLYQKYQNDILNLNSEIDKYITSLNANTKPTL